MMQPSDRSYDSSVISTASSLETLRKQPPYFLSWRFPTSPRCVFCSAGMLT